MKRITPMFFVLALLLSACQPEKDGVQIICDAPGQDIDWNSIDPSKHGQMMAKHVDKKVSNGAAKELFEQLAAKSPEDRRKLLSGRIKAL